MVEAFERTGARFAEGRSPDEWILDKSIYQKAMFAVFDTLLASSPEMTDEEFEKALDALFHRHESRRIQGSLKKYKILQAGKKDEQK